MGVVRGIQYLIDWVDNEPIDEKCHRISRALAKESLNKADFEESKRRFTEDEIVAAGGRSIGSSDSKKWID
ncbi:hypothetical protein A1355_07580 [Methylomonas koyamae]|uniref:Uncharacterized protein n=1 Tax=Methylomonas koyamae TaxID=702114 RepID=A0A177NHY1_9GAMM|nr:hypothetical protein A1355_07580 [Methylomonas koyamae]